MPEIVVSKDRIDHGLEIVGMEQDEEGYVVDPETGERVENVNGVETHVDDIGLIGLGNDGEPEFVPDTVSALLQYQNDE